MAILITLRYNNLSKMLMKTKLLLLSLFLYVGNLMVIAQNATITGTITDSETKDFLIGTTITLKDSKERGTISDANGHYTLYVPKGKHTNFHFDNASLCFSLALKLKTFVTNNKIPIIPKVYSI